MSDTLYVSGTGYAGCRMWDHAIVSSRGHDHHGKESAHSSLCAWACQIITQSGVIASVATGDFGLVSVAAVTPVVELRASSFSASQSSRAPPVFTLG